MVTTRTTASIEIVRNCFVARACGGARAAGPDRFGTSAASWLGRDSYSAGSFSCSAGAVHLTTQSSRQQPCHGPSTSESSGVPQKALLFATGPSMLRVLRSLVRTRTSLQRGSSRRYPECGSDSQLAEGALTELLEKALDEVFKLSGEE